MHYGYGPQPPMKQCPSCRGTVLLQETVCPGCGHVFRTQFQAPQQSHLSRTQPIVPSTSNPWETSPVIAFFLALFIPGLGQVYNRQGKKAFLFVILPILAITMSETDRTLAYWALAGIVAAIDAFLICRKRADLRPVAEWEFF